MLAILYALSFYGTAQIKVIDCNLAYPISNAKLIDINGKVVAESDSLGELAINGLDLTQKFSLYKAGYKIAVYNGLKKDSILCLTNLGYNINEVTIRDKQFNYLKLLRQLVEQSEATFIDDTVVAYYNFNYTATLRESQLQFKASGIMQVQLNSYPKRSYTFAPSALFCSLDYVVDSSIWQSEKLNNMKILDPLLIIWHDPMRKGRYLDKLPKRNLFVRIKNGDELNFSILDTLKSETAIYFNADSSIHSFHQVKNRANYLTYEDTISYNNMEKRYFSYRMHKSTMKTNLGIVDYQISLKSIEKEKILNNPCSIHYGATFKPVEFIEKYDIGLEVK